MTTTRRIIKNSLILFASHVLTKLINLTVVLILTRMLGAEGFGIYSFSFAFVSLFMVLGNLGINSLLTRDIARNKSRINEFLGTSLPLLFYLSVLTFVVINTAVTFISWDAASKPAIRIFSLFLIFDNFSRHFVSVFRAFEKMEYEAYTNLVERLAMLFFAVILWKFNRSLNFLLWCFAGIEALKALVAFGFLRKFFQRIRLQWFHPDILKIVKQAYPFALMIVFGTVSGRIDTVMLKIFHTDQIVAFYNVAHKIIESLTFIPENVVMALYPALSVLFVTSTAEFRKTFRKSFQYLLMIGLPLSAGIFILAAPIIHLFFEPEYAAGIVALRWLAVALAFVFLKYHFMISLNAIGRQNTFAKLAGISMLINVVFNLLLIPKYDLLGASVATIISEASVVIFAFYALKPYAQGVKFRLITLKALAATAGMSVFLWVLAAFNLFALIISGAVLYFILVVLFRLLQKEDFDYFRNMFRDKFGKKHNRQEPK